MGPARAGLEHCNAPRCNGLLEAYAAGELVPLRQFVVQTTVSPDLHVGRRYYAQAWGFFQFILAEHPENLRDLPAARGKDSRRASGCHHDAGGIHGSVWLTRRAGGVLEGIPRASGTTGFGRRFGRICDCSRGCRRFLRPAVGSRSPASGSPHAAPDEFSPPIHFASPLWAKRPASPLSEDTGFCSRQMAKCGQPGLESTASAVVGPDCRESFL